MIARRLSIALVAIAAAAPALAQLQDLDEQLRTTAIKPQKIADNFYVLFGVGGNIIVSLGKDGVLLVDDQFPQMVPKYKATIAELGGGKIDYVINTHWHFDHADGNQVLGAEGARIVSHEISREMMTKNKIINLVSAKREQPAYPESALSDITYDTSMHFYYNGERIDLMHVGPAHTAGDTVVIFRGHNVVHMGDVYNNAGYPFIDVDNGGSLQGTIAFCEAVLKELNASTVVVMGHGQVATYKDLVDYVAMLKTLRDKIAALVKGGATLAQVVAAKPTADFDAKKGDPATFVDRAYASLKKGQ